jgi:hypothetical protein
METNKLKRKDIINLLGISDTDYSRLRQRGMPQNPDNTYDVFEVVPWYMNAILDIEDPRARKDEALAILTEAKAKKLVYDVVNTQIIKELVGSIFGVIQSYLASFGRRFSTLLVGKERKEIEKILDTRTREFVKDFLNQDTFAKELKSIIDAREERARKRQGRLD